MTQSPHAFPLTQVASFNQTKQQVLGDGMNLSIEVFLNKSTDLQLQDGNHSRQVH